MPAGQPVKRGRPVTTQAHFRRIAGELRKRILANEWPSGAALPSIRALASHYGVGKRTVWLAVEALKQENRLALNPHRRLVARSRDRAFSIAGNLILEVVGDSLDDMLKGAMNYALQLGIMRAAGALYAPLAVAHDHYLRDRMPTEFLELPLGGILLWGQFKLPILRQYEKLPLPVVLIDRPEEKWKGRWVCVDNATAAFEATSRLLALGHTRIAFLRYIQMGLKDIDADSKERQQGFMRAMEAAGQGAGSNAIFNVFPNETALSPSLQALFEARPRFTAVLSADTQGATRIQQAAQFRGLLIPKHLSLVCFQGLQPDYPQISGPRLDFEAIGRLAVQTLKVPEGQPLRVRVPTVWGEGASIAPPDPSMLA